MDLTTIEKCAELFMKMLRVHPELCPHEWERTSADYRKQIAHYHCQICGAEKTEVISNEECIDFWGLTTAPASETKGKI